eukprot:11639697-Alexandrium_andersonii.AAC.1
MAGVSREDSDARTTPEARPGRTSVHIQPRATPGCSAMLVRSPRPAPPRTMLWASSACAKLRAREMRAECTQ